MINDPAPGNILFLLGGYDHEMVVIRRILLDNGFRAVKQPEETTGNAFADGQLNWDTAVLGTYSAFLQWPGQIYGIELRDPDKIAPGNYILIDHHNNLPARPAAIEQVIDILREIILETPLHLPDARELALIIANDVAHIEGMKQVNATTDEINTIRQADRTAQGVTPEEEIWAAADINNAQVVNGATVVYTRCTHFSPVTDRLYPCERLLVYNDESLCYFGYGANTMLKAAYHKEISNGTAYSGGAGEGYFGISKGKLEKKALKALTEEIAKQTIIPPYSVHSFMLPLRWDYLPENFNPLGKRKGDVSFDERTRLQDFIRLLTPQKTAGTNWWKRKFYRIDNDPKNYDELVYYHAYAANNIFDMEREDEKNEWMVNPNKVTLYFELDRIAQEKDRYIIHTADPQDGCKNRYELNLAGISLHVYTTGVAILTYTLYNRSYPGAADILRINEFGRRIYPPFIGETGLANTKQKVLADKIELRIHTINPDTSITEDFNRYADFTTNHIETHRHRKYGGYYNTVVDFPDTVKQLFPRKAFVYSAGEEAGGNKISFRLLTSDRMFFQCWYGNNQLANSLGEEITLTGGQPGFRFAQSPFWYAFMYGDKSVGSLGIGNKYLMETNLLHNTFTRWAAYGTLYGFTRDSFVCLSSSLPTLKAAGAPDISLHVQTIYYTTVVLCLAQRASVLRFSGEVAALADLGKEGSKLVSKRINDLNLNYIEFINKIFYREITPEIQGIEFYRHIQQALGIETDANDLKAEINELHNFVMMKKQDEQTRQANKLSSVATLFLPASFVASILGIGFIDSNARFTWFGKPLSAVRDVLILLAIVMAISLIVLYIKDIIQFFNRKKK
jgi:hypothetical protein